MDYDILTIAKNYLKALKKGKTGKDLSIFFHPDAVQVELPNRLNPKGVVCNVAQVLERAESEAKTIKIAGLQNKKRTVEPRYRGAGSRVDGRFSRYIRGIASRRFFESAFCHVYQIPQRPDHSPAQLRVL